MGYLQLRSIIAHFWVWYGVASSHVHAVGVGVSAMGPNLAGALKLMATDTRAEFHDVCELCDTLATAPQYIAIEATISKYRMRMDHRLAFLLIADGGGGGNWRARNAQAFHYRDGRWGQVGVFCQM